jgi:hypothetical protein
MAKVKKVNITVTYYIKVTKLDDTKRIVSSLWGKKGDIIIIQIGRLHQFDQSHRIDLI